MAEHVDITDPELHEPKGVAAASADTVYVADGAGSGAWQAVGVDQLDYAELLVEVQSDIDDGTLELNGKYYIHIVIPDISTADEVLVPIMIDSTFVGARSVLGASISGADANIAFKDALANNMNTAMVVAQSGSATGDQDSFTASSNNVLTAPTYMQVETDGASTGTAKLFLTLEFEAMLNG